MHMIQHLLLIDLAPILVLLGLTKVLLRPATRRLVRLEQAAGPLAHPVFAIALYVVVMWIWHIPPMYDAALEHSVVHVLEHITFAVAGGLYWWHLLSPIRSRKRLGGMGPVLYMVSTKLGVGLLGVGLAFSPDAIYDFYERQPRWWDISAGTDQAIGGLIMATEQSIVMGIALTYLFVRALGESERDEQRAERAADRAEAEAEAVADRDRALAVAAAAAEYDRARARERAETETAESEPAAPTADRPRKGSDSVEEV